MKSTGRLLNYADFLGHSDIYVETGTCYGQSVERALVAGYKTIKSVELNEIFYHHCADKFKDTPEVELFLGNSVDVLPEMLKKVKGRAVLFLDAHPAGPGTAGHNEYEEGDGRYGQHEVIQKELKHIFKHGKNHLIIIDDQNGRNAHNEVYMAYCLKYNPNYTFYLYDENLSGSLLYPDKILVCVP